MLVGDCLLKETTARFAWRYPLSYYLFSGISTMFPTREAFILAFEIYHTLFNFRDLNFTCLCPVALQGSVCMLEMLKWCKLFVYSLKSLRLRLDFSFNQNIYGVIFVHMFHNILFSFYWHVLIWYLLFWVPSCFRFIETLKWYLWFAVMFVKNGCILSVMASGLYKCEPYVCLNNCTPFFVSSVSTLCITILFNPFSSCWLYVLYGRSIYYAVRKSTNSSKLTKTFSTHVQHAVASAPRWLLLSSCLTAIVCHLTPILLSSDQGHWGCNSGALEEEGCCWSRTYG